jgi:hypothetical protein
MSNDLLTFRIDWKDWQGETFASDEIRKYDLSAAIVYACNRLKAGRGHAGDAHGFFVEVQRERETSK